MESLNLGETKTAPEFPNSSPRWRSNFFGELKKFWNHSPETKIVLVLLMALLLGEVIFGLTHRSKVAAARTELQSESLTLSCDQALRDLAIIQEPTVWRQNNSDMRRHVSHVCLNDFQRTYNDSWKIRPALETMLGQIDLLSRMRSDIKAIDFSGITHTNRTDLQLQLADLASRIARGAGFVVVHPSNSPELNVHSSLPILPLGPPHHKVVKVKGRRGRHK